MDKQNLTKLLRLQSAELMARTPFCPEDQVIAEYFDCDLANAETEKLERHLSDCHFCLARIGVLERLEENSSNKRIPEKVLATAKQLAHKAPVRRPAMAPAWAAAAMVVIALFAIIKGNRGPEPGISPVVPPIEEYSRQLRNVNRLASDINVLNPLPGAGIAPGSLIEWAAVPGNLHYNISVLSNSGDVLWTERLERTDWVLDESLGLAAGSQYYFRVDALLPDGSSLRSKHVVFQVKER
jgi:hypothetical protein